MDEKKGDVIFSDLLELSLDESGAAVSYVLEKFPFQKQISNERVVWEEESHDPLNDEKIRAEILCIIFMS